MSQPNRPTPTGSAPPSDPSDNPGYPHRTFDTHILPCDASGTITFTEASSHPSSSTGSSLASIADQGREPFRLVRPRISSPTTRASLDTAAAHLRRGQVVAFPTETVYGLGASALDQSASQKIYAAKKRPADNPLIVHVSDLDMLSRLLPDDYRPSPVYITLMRKFWPGALTLLLPVDAQRPKVPNVITCGQPSVAVRMPSHAIARALISLADLPLAAPSANASGRPSPTTAAHVMRDLGGQLDADALASGSSPSPNAGKRAPLGRLQYILDGGPSDVGLESTVVDGISTPGELRVLRPGGITVEQISDALAEAGLLQIQSDEARSSTSAAVAADAVRLRVYGKDLARSAEQESNPTTPGMKYRHYSPTARVVMLLPSRLLAAAFGEGQEGHDGGDGGNNGGGSSVAARQVVESLSNSSSTNAGDEIARQARTFSEIVSSQLSKLGPGQSGKRVRVGIMMSNDSDLARWVNSTCTPSTSLPSSSTMVHRHLLPPLTLPSLSVEIHPFDLGPTASGETYAQRMFDGLRTLDEGPLRLEEGMGEGEGGRCDLIFVEALHDDGVGLAVMNRLKKASSESVVVDC